MSNLKECKELESIDLSNNMLTELDFSPLIDCMTLRDIRLKNNHLKELDFWPLVNCPSLVNIDLSENRIQGIDLSPVFLRAKVRMDSSVVIQADFILRYIYTHKELVERFHLVRPDGAPWHAIPVIIWINYRKKSDDMSWSKIKQPLQLLIKSIDKEKWYNCQRGLLIGLDMTELSGFDGNPMKLLDTTDSNMTYKEARQAIYDRTLELLGQQFEDNGPTLFLDIEKMKNTRASKLIPHIVELRKRELENTTLQIKGSKVFLKPLWFTHYGLTILKATGKGLTTDLEGLQLLKSSFSELNLNLKTKDVQDVYQSYNGNGSSSMQRYVFNYIQGFYD
ncbi:hypothetical protein EU527_06805 [Candidatus Thorarchaeota archaeon]|nr:MAG: hypothetical protein EU527_06805 [Candidatus Thorarchaeota archaeon]